MGGHGWIDITPQDDSVAEGISPGCWEQNGWSLLESFNVPIHMHTSPFSLCSSLQKADVYGRRLRGSLLFCFLTRFSERKPSRGLEGGERGWVTESPGFLPSGSLWAGHTPLPRVTALSGSPLHILLSLHGVPLLINPGVLHYFSGFSIFCKTL